MAFVSAETMRKYKQAIKSRESLNGKYFSTGMEFLETAIKKLSEYKSQLEELGGVGVEIAGYLQDNLKMSMSYFQMYIDNNDDKPPDFKTPRKSTRRSLGEQVSSKRPKDIKENYQNIAMKLQAFKKRNQSLKMNSQGISLERLKQSIRKNMKQRAEIPSLDFKKLAPKMPPKVFGNRKFANRKKSNSKSVLQTEVRRPMFIKETFDKPPVSKKIPKEKRNRFESSVQYEVKENLRNFTNSMCVPAQSTASKRKPRKNFGSVLVPGRPGTGIKKGGSARQPKSSLGNLGDLKMEFQQITGSLLDSESKRSRSKSGIFGAMSTGTLPSMQNNLKMTRKPQGMDLNLEITQLNSEIFHLSEIIKNDLATN